ncbi:hypothetical protein AB0J63_38715 [Streptosporangium canum]|uniref:hypothetical protein n=1 Tax=Streptosporangium canum TaxID=324952 RepID=UPI00342132BD
MVEQHRAAALRAFVDQLNELRDLAGEPSLSDLRKLSKPVIDGGAGLPRELTESTTHDILAGKRKRVPDWAWVVSFVAACRMAAEQTGLDVRALGEVAVWNQRWREARAARPDPPTIRAATAPSADQQPVADPVPPPAPAARPVIRIEFAPLPEETQRLLQIYGRTGTRLLRQLHDGDGPGYMRLAVIALLKGWPDEARQWLRRAGDAGQVDAPKLFNDSHRLRAAAQHAYSYARHEQDQRPKKPSVAMFLYRLAADHGHAGAAYQLALIHQDKEEDGAAASLFGRAAAGGDINAGPYRRGSRRMGELGPAHADDHDRIPPSDEPGSPSGSRTHNKLSISDRLVTSGESSTSAIPQSAFRELPVGDRPQ